MLASTPTAAEAVVGGFGGGVRAAVGVVAAVPGFGWVGAGLSDSTLFEAGGGTEQTTAIVAGIAAVAAVAAAIVASRQGIGRSVYVRLLPVAMLAGFAVTLNVLDQWATGSAPHYGSYKFTFLAAIVVSAACLPVGLLLLDSRASRMTLARWAGVGAVVFLLTVDSLLVRSIAAARPEQWSPPIPFDNPQSYWWPADVNGTGTQPISENPVACVYLPQGAAAPSGILDSQLSDPQRVYSCTRLLAGLAASDSACSAAGRLAASRVAHEHPPVGGRARLPERDARVSAAEARDPSRRRQQRHRAGDSATACLRATPPPLGSRCSRRSRSAGE